MKMEKEVERYLEYCRYRKELDEKTIKAYRIDFPSVRFQTTAF